MLGVCSGRDHRKNALKKGVLSRGEQRSLFCLLRGGRDQVCPAEGVGTDTARKKKMSQKNLCFGEALPRGCQERPFIEERHQLHEKESKHQHP